MISLLICLIIALIVAAAVLMVVRALLALPGFAAFTPFGNVIYALVVLLIVLIVISYCFGGVQHAFKL